jgi:hypothetical protein
VHAVDDRVEHLLAQGIERRLWQVAGDAGEGQVSGGYLGFVEIKRQP